MVIEAEHLEVQRLGRTVLGDVCANQCEEFGIGNCDPTCVDKDGYNLVHEEQAVAASAEVAAEAALEAARLAAPGHCSNAVVELCYYKAQTLANGGGYIAKAGVYCKIT